MPTYQELKAEYQQLWDAIAIRPAKRPAVIDVVETILLPANRRRYVAVQAETGVPWMVVACIHSLEASLSFKGHLHNGDPLTARTVHVPAGRPKTGTPPFSWEDSAIDALKMKQTSEISGWSIPECLFYFERYNGWGYRTGAGRNTTPPKRSPYLWSYTTHYEKGKYTADGTFSREAVSKQAGAAAILRLLMDATQTEPGDADNVVQPPATSERPMLQKGNRGEDVADLQKLLRDKGFKPGDIDGVFGVQTRDAVIEFQTVRNLEVDGIVGPETWGALLTATAPDLPSTGTAGLRKAVLDFAITEASKARKHQPGNVIDQLVLDPLRPILKQLGHLGPNDNDNFYNWCAAWVTYITRHAGIKIPDRYKTYWASVAKVDAWRYMAIDTDSWIRSSSGPAKPGDIVVYNWDDDADTDHIGIVKDFLPGSKSINACEGNKGNQEVITSRSFSFIAGYIDLDKLAAKLGVGPAPFVPGPPGPAPLHVNLALGAAPLATKKPKGKKNQ